MIAQIKYAFWDISDNLLRFIINFVQITLSVMLIAYAILKIAELDVFKDNMSYLDNLENTYIMTDITSDEHMDDVMKDESLPNQKEFYNYLKNSDDFSSYTCYESYINTKSDSEQAYFVDENFIKVFNLKDENGNSLEGVFSKDYGDYIPIILGRGYRDRYNVGEIIETTNDKDLIVAAFLASNSFYYNLSWQNDPISLDAEIICPAMRIYVDDISEYFLAANSTRIITEDPKALDDIAAKSKELGLYDFHFKSLETQVNSIREVQLRTIQTALITMGLILSLCAACMIASLLTFVEDHLREFAIHLLSGATILSIIGRILIQVGIPVLLANIVAYVAFRDIYVSMRLLITSVALCIVITVIPIVKISVLGINGILKRCE